MDDAKLVAASAIALAVTLFAIFSMRPLARRLGLVDRPDERKCHRGRVPLIGGLCFFVGTVAGLLYMGYIDRFVASLLVPCALIVMTGAVDDLHNLSVRSRLLIQTCAAGLVIAATGVYLDHTGSVFGETGFELGMLGIPITIIAVIGLINAFNMLDGLDGLAASLAMVSIGAIMLFAHADWPSLGVMLLLQVLFASLVPYLLVNLGWPDGRKVFMGDAGSTLIGFLLAWGLIFLSHRGIQRLAPVDALWCVALPVMDTLGVMFRRMKKRLSPFKPDRQHLHHLLQDTGCSPRVTLAVIITASGFFVLTGYALRNASETVSAVVFLSILVAYVLRFQQALEWVCRQLRAHVGAVPDARLPDILALAANTPAVAGTGPDPIRALCVMATPPDAIRMAPIARQLSDDARFDTKVCVAAQRDQTPLQVLRLFGIQPDMQLRILPRSGQSDDVTSMTLGGMKRVLAQFKPDVVVVPSDASTTLATTLAAFYQQIPVACVEAGDDRQPGAGRLGEATRKITSTLASLHFTPSESTGKQLQEGGVPSDRIVVSGDTAVGTLRAAAERIRESATLRRDLAQCFAFLRSGNPMVLVADADTMQFGNADLLGRELAEREPVRGPDAGSRNDVVEHVCLGLREVATRRPDVDIVYPMDPDAAAGELLRGCPNAHLIAPTDYLSFAYLLTQAHVVLADSHELAAEMAALGKRVLLMRDNAGRATAVDIRSVGHADMHEHSIASGVFALLDDRQVYDTGSRAVGRVAQRDACTRVVEALAGFVHPALVSTAARQATAPQPRRVGEPLREPS